MIATQASGFLAWRKGRPAVIMEALARAKRLRTEALTAQAARLGEGTARTVRNAERAKKHGMVVLRQTDVRRERVQSVRSIVHRYTISGIKV